MEYLDSILMLMKIKINMIMREYILGIHMQ